MYVRTRLGASAEMCEYAAPPEGWSYVRGPGFDPNTGCGLILTEDAARPAAPTQGPPAPTNRPAAPPTPSGTPSAGVLDQATAWLKGSTVVSGVPNWALALGAVFAVNILTPRRGRPW